GISGARRVPLQRSAGRSDAVGGCGEADAAGADAAGRMRCQARRMSDIVVEELPVPRERSGREWDDFVATVEVRNVCEELGYGTPDVRVTAETLHGWFQD